MKKTSGPTSLKSRTFSKVGGRLLAVLLLCGLPISAAAQLEYRVVLSGAIEIKLPAGFTRMNDTMVRSKYPPANRPTEVYTNANATVNLALRRTQQPLKDNEVFVQGSRLASQLAAGGKVKIDRSENLNAGGMNVYLFGFHSRAKDEPVYNLMFIFSLNGNMVAGSVNYTLSQRNFWEQPAYEIAGSLRKIP